jgi:hypothetical protein
MQPCCKANTGAKVIGAVPTSTVTLHFLLVRTTPFSQNENTLLGSLSGQEHQNCSDNSQQDFAPCRKMIDELKEQKQAASITMFLQRK